MKFVVITHVKHIQNDESYFGYGPYVREMNIWFKYADEVIIVAPSVKGIPNKIDVSYKHQKIKFINVPGFSFTGLKSNFISVFKMPSIFWNIFSAMKNSDHIHLRCPGNMGLIACFVQILFPGKIKTAKYAGNWDPKSKQPWTYRLQKAILSNTFLTRKMQVLVYGEWPNQSKNIKPFFTATYSESEKENVQKDDFLNRIKFVFVGSLVTGKNPIYAIKLVEKLINTGYNVTLDLYGEGLERSFLQNYVQINNLGNNIFLRGNHDKETLKKAYKESHFVILPSKSEGWPKAIAEGMFWGCVPIATKVSCVPYMLDYGSRGVLLEMDLKKDTKLIEYLIVNRMVLLEKSKFAMEWSRNYTADIFSEEIEKLL